MLPLQVHVNPFQFVWTNASLVFSGGDPFASNFYKVRVGSLDP